MVIYLIYMYDLLTIYYYQKSYGIIRKNFANLNISSTLLREQNCNRCFESVAFSYGVLVLAPVFLISMYTIYVYDIAGITQTSVL